MATRFVCGANREAPTAEQTRFFDPLRSTVGSHVMSCLSTPPCHQIRYRSEPMRCDSVRFNGATITLFYSSLRVFLGFASEDLIILWSWVRVPPGPPNFKKLTATLRRFSF